MSKGEERQPEVAGPKTQVNGLVSLIQTPNPGNFHSKESMNAGSPAHDKEVTMTLAEYMDTKALANAMGLLFPDYGDAAVVYRRTGLCNGIPIFPAQDGYLPIANLVYGADGQPVLRIYAPAHIKAQIIQGLKLKGKTPGVIQKYISSLVRGALSAKMLNARHALRIAIFPGDWPRTMDGDVYIRASLAKLLGWRNGAVRRVLTNKGLVKGRIVVLPDHEFPEEVDILASEIKGNLVASHLLDNEALCWQAASDMGTHDTSSFSIQSMTSLGASELLSAEMEETVESALKFSQRDFKLYAATITDNGPDVDDPMLSGESKDIQVQVALTAVGIHSNEIPATMKRLAFKVSKDADPGDVRWKGQNAEEILMSSSYINVFHTEMLMEARGKKETAADYLAKIALAKLKPLDAKGRVVLYAPPELHSIFKDGEVIVAFRSPNGATSGTVCVVRHLSSLDAAFLGIAEDVLYAMPRTEVFKALWSANEGGDLDDAFYLARGKMAEIFERGMRKRNKFLAPHFESSEYASRYISGTVMPYLRSRLQGKTVEQLNEIPGIVAILQGLATVEVETSADENGLLTQRLTAQPVWNRCPVEKSTEGMSDDELFDAVFLAPENPFAALVGIAANGVMCGMGIFARLVELPSNIKREKNEIARILAGVFLSDIVDASIKGTGFEAAWKAYWQQALVNAYVALRLTEEKAGTALRVWKPLRRRMSRGFQALTIFATARRDTGRVSEYDGSTITEEVQENGFRVTHYGLKHAPGRMVDLFDDFYGWLDASMQEEIEEGNRTKTIVRAAEAVNMALAPHSNFRKYGGLLFSRAFGFNVQTGKSRVEEEQTRRMKVFEEWRWSHYRSTEEIQAALAWAFAPSKDAFKAIWRSISKNFPGDVKSQNLALLGLAQIWTKQAGDDSKNLRLHREGYRYRVSGGISPYVLFTDTSLPEDHPDFYRGPLSAVIAAVVAQQERKIATKAAFVLSYKVAQESLDPLGAIDRKKLDLLGLDIAEIVAHHGVKLAVCGEFGVANQPEALAGIAEKLSPKKTEGRTQRQIAEETGYLNLLRQRIPGVAMEISEVEWLKNSRGTYPVVWITFAEAEGPEPEKVKVETVKAFVSTTAGLANRLADKAEVEAKLGLSEDGRGFTGEIQTPDGKTIATEYTRIVYGDHGPYIEFDAASVDLGKWDIRKKGSQAWYDEARLDGVMVYIQKRDVSTLPNPPAGKRSTRNNRKEGYADYKPGMLYVDPFKITLKK